MILFKMKNGLDIEKPDDQLILNRRLLKVFGQAVYKTMDLGVLGVAGSKQGGSLQAWFEKFRRVSISSS